jgi:hypothetical protein
MRFVDEPQVEVCVFGNREDISLRSSLNESEPPIFQITYLLRCSNPNPPAVVLKKRTWLTSVEFSVSPWASGAGNCYSAVVPSVQSAVSSEPDASILVGYN